MATMHPADRRAMMQAIPRPLHPELNGLIEDCSHRFNLSGGGVSALVGRLFLVEEAITPETSYQKAQMASKYDVYAVLDELSPWMEQAATRILAEESTATSKPAIRNLLNALLLDLASERQMPERTAA